DPGSDRRCPQGDGKPSLLLEVRRVDALREAARLVQRDLHVVREALEERLRRLGIVFDERRRVLELDRERNEPLLEAVVQLALERTAVGIARTDESFPRGSQVLELAAEILERHG